jgi:hypothetical protein
MTLKLVQLPASLFVQRRPLTNIALDNKIRAMLSQFRPYERRLTTVSYDDRRSRVLVYIEPLNSIREECLKSELSSLTKPVRHSSMMMIDKKKIDDYALINTQTDECNCTYRKVTEWLEHLDYDCKKRKRI